VDYLKRNDYYLLIIYTALEAVLGTFM